MPLHIGICISIDIECLPEAGDGDTFASGVTPAFMQSYTNNTETKIAYLAKPTGFDTKFYYGINNPRGIAPATGNPAGFLWKTPIPLETNDQWIKWQLTDDWNGAGAYMGCTLRHSEAADTYYGFWHDLDDYVLFKSVAGSETTLASGALTPVDGDEFRFEINGADLIVYKNDVELCTASDSAIESGDSVGIIGKGFDPDNSIMNIVAGDLPYSGEEVIDYDQWLPNTTGTDLATANDFSVGGENVYNASVTSDFTTVAAPSVPVEWEADLGQLYRLSRLHFWGDAGNLAHDWEDVDVFMKRESGDAWTQVLDAGTSEPYNTSVWRDIPFDTEFVGRYVKIAVNSTAHATNQAAGEEIEFWSGNASRLFYLDQVVRQTEVIGAWLAKGALQYANTLVDWSAAHNPNTLLNNLTNVVGAVPWTSEAGWAFDGTDYLSTGYTTDGGDHTLIARISGAASEWIAGDAAGAGNVNIEVKDGTTIDIANMSNIYTATVADTSADMVIALAGDKLYIDGSLVTTFVSYSAQAGPAAITLGGVAGSGVASSAVMTVAALYDRQLTATEVAAITTKMQAV